MNYIVIVKKTTNILTGFNFFLTNEIINYTGLYSILDVMTLRTN
jgi:hypothetical protein